MPGLSLASPQIGCVKIQIDVNTPSCLILCAASLILSTFILIFVFPALKMKILLAGVLLKYAFKQSVFNCNNIALYISWQFEICFNISFRLGLGLGLGLLVFYVTCDDISVIYVTAQMCRRTEEEVRPTVGLPTP